MIQHLWSATVRITNQVKPEFITVSTKEKNIGDAATKAISDAKQKFPEAVTDVIEVKYTFAMEN